MRRLDTKEVKALCALEQNPDFRVIMDWFLDSAHMQDEVLRKAESATQLYRAQGAVKELLEICQHAASPRDLAGKMAMEKAGIHAVPKDRLA